MRDPAQPWRSLEELSGGAAELAARVDPFLLDDPVRRRAFLKLMGGSLGLAGLGACTRQPTERIHPFAREPEHVIPGRPLYFATAMPWPTGALGLLVESHLGRPTKIEGNPEHPASLGATDALAQAQVLELYDPERSRVVVGHARIATFDDCLAELVPALEAARAKRGAGLRILTPSVTSPALASTLLRWRAAHPEARWVQYEPLNRDSARAGALMAFGRDVSVRSRLERAEVILALGADFLSGPGGVRLARAFADRRRARGAETVACRLYVAEPSPTITGAMADERLALAPSGLAHLASLMSQAVAAGGTLRTEDVRFEGHPHPFPERADEVFAWVSAAARDLLAHRGKSLVLVGDREPPIVHALAHALNHDMLGNAGATLDYGAPVELEPSDQTASLAALVEEMRAGKVEVLAILGGNPLYDAPPDLEFGAALERVPLRLHLGLFADETAERCHWHVPEAHFLEAWGDARAFDGTVSIVQPLIAPLYGGRSALELAAVLAGDVGAQGYELVRERWRDHFEAGGDFELGWRRALHDGVVAGTGEPALELPLARRPIEWPDPATFARAPLELVLAADPSVHDGRFANNAWLQELPRPISKLTWDNAALVAPATARRLGLAQGDVVRLAHAGRELEAPVWIQPGQAEDCVTLHLGYGRTHAGSVGTGVGCNAYRLRVSTTAGRVAVLELVRTGRRHEFAVTQEHHSMEGRDLAREVTLTAFRGGDTGAPAHHGPEHASETSLYPGFAYEGHAWGLAIDLNACVGCNACIVACQAENNIPVVGKDEVRRGREMHWIRVDRWFQGAAGAPLIRFQPVTCMHCENAPCEVVCPVGATVHGPEGLNEMVYNRCIGTRYCSNNCPYKVRRFNFFKYADDTHESLKLLRNPDVTVRSRGVMEKCTYCVQRINQARIAAKKAERPLRGGEIVTACQQVCPARAITFGDVNDAEGALAGLRREPRHYALLTELNTKPRTTYLARITHPNPELRAQSEPSGGGGH